ncbi:hypothetical protein HK405_004736 [Cladochytrium tenue]|nr:hypothetical protein HK405_004736 [Cladochytrium tenue]
MLPAPPAPPPRRLGASAGLGPHRTGSAGATGAAPVRYYEPNDDDSAARRFLAETTFVSRRIGEAVAPADSFKAICKALFVMALSTSTTGDPSAHFKQFIAFPVNEWLCDAWNYVASLDGLKKAPADSDSVHRVLGSRIVVKAPLLILGPLAIDCHSNRKAHFRYLECTLRRCDPHPPPLSVVFIPRFVLTDVFPMASPLDANNGRNILRRFHEGFEVLLECQPFAYESDLADSVYSYEVALQQKGAAPSNSISEYRRYLYWPVFGADGHEHGAQVAIHSMIFLAPPEKVQLIWGVMDEEFFQERLPAVAGQEKLIEHTEFQAPINPFLDQNSEAFRSYLDIPAKLRDVEEKEATIRVNIQLTSTAEISQEVGETENVVALNKVLLKMRALERLTGDARDKKMLLLRSHWQQTLQPVRKEATRFRLALDDRLFDARQKEFHAHTEAIVNEKENASATEKFEPPQMIDCITFSLPEFDSLKALVSHVVVNGFDEKTDKRKLSLEYGKFPRSSGDFRFAYHGLDGTRKIVFKSFKLACNPTLDEVIEESTILSCMAQAFCDAAATLFNKVVTEKLAVEKRVRIKFVESFAFRCAPSESAHDTWFMAEPRLPTFGKFTSSKGGAVAAASDLFVTAPRDAKNVLEAFSHWTYTASGGAFLITDLQGRFAKTLSLSKDKDGETFVLTDPALALLDDGLRHSLRHLLDANYGSRTLEYFRGEKLDDEGKHVGHTCSEVCKLLGLEPF